MSDNSDYYSDSDSDSENSQEELLKNNSNKKTVLFKPTNNIIDYENNDDSDNEIEDNEIEDLEEQIGGEDILEYDTDDNEESDNSDSDFDEDIDKEDDTNLSENKKSNKQQKNKKINNNNNNNLIVDNDDENEYDDEYDENYLQKFDNEITKNYINEYHPECLIHNYDEIYKLTNVIRNSDNIIVDPLHRTNPFLTKFEKAKILGQRAKQIETGAKPFVKVPENIIDSYIIAELELKEKKIPFIIRRPIPGGAFEYWNLKDLEIIDF